MGLKSLAANIMNYSGMQFMLTKVRGRIKKHIPILAYHRIFDIDEKIFPYDEELISASSSEFEKQIMYLNRNFDPITFSDLIKYKHGDMKLPKRPVLITFDDGHLDNYEVAYPILKKYATSAMIFLSTEYMDNPCTFWFDMVVYAIKNCKFECIEEVNFHLYLADSVDDKIRQSAYANMLEYLKSVPNSVRLSEVDKLKNYIDTTSENSTYSAPLSWDQVIEMSNNGIEFGSHTVTHPVLSNLTNEELDFELTESKKIIEEKTGKRCDVISYPVGGKYAFNKHVLDKVKALGYEIGVSYIPDTNFDIEDKYSLKRLHVERYTDMHYFKSMLALPEIFAGY